MTVSGAQQDFDFEDRAEAVRRALGGLVGTRKGISLSKPATTHEPVATPATQQFKIPDTVPRIPLQSTSNLPSRQQIKDVSKAYTHHAPATKDEIGKPMELYTPVSQASRIEEPVTKINATSKDAQELLCQLRMTEKQPIRGLDTETAASTAAQSKQRQGLGRRSRDSMLGRNGKKKTEIEKENDKLLDELEALGEPALEMPGETPVDMNQRLRKEATAAMLKHSFFVKKRVTPPASASTMSGDCTNRS